jgi:hypothetical protein
VAFRIFERSEKLDLDRDEYLERGETDAED